MKNLIVCSLFALTVALVGCKNDAEKANDTMKDMASVIEQMADAAEKHKDDCGKMAEALDGIMSKNEGKLKAAKQFADDMKKDKSKEELEEMAKKMDKDVMKRVQDASMKMMGPMMKCAGDEKMKAVTDKWQQYQ